MSTNKKNGLYIRSARLNQFFILHELGANSNLTQAELARRCKLSVGMINNYLQAFKTRGLVTYQRQNARDFSYHVTPAGKKFIQLVKEELREAAKQIAEDLERLGV